MLNNYVGRNDEGHTSVLYLRGLLEPESTLFLAYPLRGVHILLLLLLLDEIFNMLSEICCLLHDCMSAAFISSSDVGTARTAANELVEHMTVTVV